jgi:BMFP domain-containing protein YqiC
MLVIFRRLRYQVDMPADSIDRLARKLAEVVPQGIKSVRDDLEQNFRSVLQAGLGKLDLVSREEFEVQEAVLARTRAKLESLEERLTSIETPVAKPRRKKSKKKTVRKKPAN